MMNGPKVGLVAGDLEAVFLPARGMLGASLRHRGEEILRRSTTSRKLRATGSTAGVPLLHPWANRLSGTRYRVAGRGVGDLLLRELRPLHPVPSGRSGTAEVRALL